MEKPFLKRDFPRWYLGEFSCQEDSFGLDGLQHQSTLFVGAGNNIIFQQCINYLIDTYGPYAASAISATTILRSLLAAGLPLAAKPMFHNLGVGPAASLMGGIACLALPIPFVFMKYGRTLREKSIIAPTSSD
ncbi:hypothetical protein AnigIFM56816_005249 [Aspergillus niger]|nr:hypothetical protein AnigIFM56816_005249 [Aspergillus niger]